VWKPPAVTAVAVVMPVTRTGTLDTSVVVAGSPSWPASFRPSIPACRPESARRCDSHHRDGSGARDSSDRTGVEELVVVPLPS